MDIQKQRSLTLKILIDNLNHMSVDGETMEHILDKTNMKEQMLRQLFLQANNETLVQLLMEKINLNS
jgi:hypothetical protein